MALQVQKIAGWGNAMKYKSPIVCRLGIGRFIGDVLEGMEKCINKKDKVRFMHYSGHDNTLSPLMSAFQVFDERQPSMGSAVVLELYEDGNGVYWVRFQYQGKDLLLPDKLKPWPPVKQEQQEGAEKVPKVTKRAKQEEARLNAMKDVDIVVYDKDNNIEEVRQESMILCPYEQFKALAHDLIPINYKEECALKAT